MSELFDFIGLVWVNQLWIEGGIIVGVLGDRLGLVDVLLHRVLRIKKPPTR